MAPTPKMSIVASAVNFLREQGMNEEADAVRDLHTTLTEITRQAARVEVGVADQDVVTASIERAHRLLSKLNKPSL